MKHIRKQFSINICQTVRQNIFHVFFFRLSPECKTNNTSGPKVCSIKMLLNKQTLNVLSSMFAKKKQQRKKKCCLSVKSDIISHLPEEVTHSFRRKNPSSLGIQVKSQFLLTLSSGEMHFLGDLKMHHKRKSDKKIVCQKGQNVSLQTILENAPRKTMQLFTFFLLKFYFWFIRSFLNAHFVAL